MQKQKMVLFSGQLLDLEQAANILSDKAFADGSAQYVNVEIPDGSTIEDVKTLDVLTLKIEYIKPEIVYFSSREQYSKWISGQAVEVSLIQPDEVVQTSIVTPLEIESYNGESSATVVKKY